MFNYTTSSQSANYLTSFIVIPLLLLVTACGGTGEPKSEPKINKSPVVSITSPLTGGSESEEETITFTATANDEEDGDISSKIQWSSNIDGDLGEGGGVSVQLNAGEHTITALVTDSANKSSNVNIEFRVLASFGVATVSWTAPTENTDNSELTDLEGYKVYYGLAEDQLTSSVSIDSNQTLAMVIEGLQTEQTYYFAVTAINQLGIESELSNISSKFIPG